MRNYNWQTIKIAGRSVPVALLLLLLIATVGAAGFFTANAIDNVADITAAPDGYSVYLDAPAATCAKISGGAAGACSVAQVPLGWTATITDADDTSEFRIDFNLRADAANLGPLETCALAVGGLAGEAAVSYYVPAGLTVGTALAVGSITNGRISIDFVGGSLVPNQSLPGVTIQQVFAVPAGC